MPREHGHTMLDVWIGDLHQCNLQYLGCMQRLTLWQQNAQTDSHDKLEQTRFIAIQTFMFATLLVQMWQGAANAFPWTPCQPSVWGWPASQHWLSPSASPGLSLLHLRVAQECG